MSYLEELLPEFRKGAKIRLPLWDKGQYLRYDIQTKNIINDKGEDTDIMGCHLSSDRWEFYQEPEPDWEYIIKNKCLCWFWDDITEEPNFADRLLAVVENESGIKYMTKGKVSFAYCRPVRRDEVTFYEDRKEE